MNRHPGQTLYETDWYDQIAQRESVSDGAAKTALIGALEQPAHIQASYALPSDGSVARIQATVDARGLRLVNMSSSQLVITTENGEVYYCASGTTGSLPIRAQSHLAFNTAAASTNAGAILVWFTSDDVEPSLTGGTGGGGGGGGGVVPIGAANAATSRVATSVASALLLAARATRTGALFLNTDPANTVNVGTTNPATLANTIPLAPGASLAANDIAAWYAIASAGTPSVAILEEYN